MSNKKAAGKSTAKRKKAKNTPPDQDDIRTLSFQRFLASIQEIHRDCRQQHGQRLCFILGAGASFESGIPLAGQLVDTWLKDLHSYEETPPPIQEWCTADNLDIPDFTWKNRAAFYGKVFEKRFVTEPDRGQGWLEQAMEDARPSWGYNIFSQLLDHHPRRRAYDRETLRWILVEPPL
jgi:hypothetical protein